MAQSFSISYLLFGLSKFKLGITKEDREFNAYLDDFKQVIKNFVIEKKNEPDD